VRANVRFGSLTDIGQPIRHVRLASESGHVFSVAIDGLSIFEGGSAPRHGGFPARTQHSLLRPCYCSRHGLAHPSSGCNVRKLDTVKAPYYSIYLPINMMADFIAPRRRIVIGKISDYASNPYPKYRDIYRASRQVADQVIFVGDDAHRSKAPPDDIASGRFVEKRNMEQAAEETAIPGEIILICISSAYLSISRVQYAAGCMPAEFGRIAWAADHTQFHFNPGKRGRPGTNGGDPTWVRRHQQTLPPAVARRCYRTDQLTVRTPRTPLYRPAYRGLESLPLGQRLAS